MKNRVRAVALTTFDISQDGETVQINVRDEAGNEAALELPTLCLNQLLMTLPHIIQAALRRSRNDAGLRLAHPLERYRFEQGERNAAGEMRYILTLYTDKDFHVSFAVSQDLLASIAYSIVEDVIENPADSAAKHLHS